MVVAKLKLTLYVTGGSINSDAAIRNIKNILKKHKVKFSLDVIDIVEKPDLAEEHKILATPVLIKESPLPFKKVVGDLSDEGIVLGILGLITGVFGKA